jgi:hypothetical protein
MRRPITSATFAPLVAGLLVACAPSFADESTVTDLRVLSIAADAPEVVLDVGPLAAIETLPTPAQLATLLAQASATLPETFPTLTLQPLVVDPRGQGRPLRLRAVVCVSGTGGEAPGVLDMTAGAIRDTIGRNPCAPDAPLLADQELTPPAGAAEDGVSLAVPFTPSREMLAAALVSDPLGAVFGLAITIQITVTAGDEQVVARKRVVFVPRLTPEQTANRNPVITGLTYRASEDADPIPFDLQDPTRAPPEVVPGGELIIEPARADTETYPTRVADRRTGRLSTVSAIEALRYAFFTAEGTFFFSRSGTEPSPLRTPTLHPLATTYRAPRGDPSRTAASSDLVPIWVVVRDERAGASFVRAAIRLLR